jgi:hypothetical protein
MPFEYNTPDWLDETYIAEMRRILAKLDEVFVPQMTLEALFRYKAEHELDGPQEFRIPVPDQIIWWGKGYNIGHAALFSAPGPLYRELFPSAARSAIEVYEKGPSAAEESDQAYQLVRSLSVSECGLQRIEEIAMSLTLEQKHIVCDCLGLISRRLNDEGRIASNAVLDFWMNSTQQS